jgi:hypothetical protein
MAGSQRGVRLEATAAGAVGGGAQQPIGLALKPPSFGYARSEVVDPTRVPEGNLARRASAAKATNE